MLFWCAPLAAQGRVVGTVRDSAGAPIAGAVVRVPALGRSAATDAAGRFSLDVLPAGSHVLSAAAPGVATARRTVVVRDGAIEAVVFELRTAATTLGRVLVLDRPAPDAVRRAPPLLGTIHTTGARSEIVTLTGTDANLAEKVPRQVFARVPGILVYDMDGAGNQTNVSTRGLDPHRSWEFNVRQDGVLINSDIYGYPASHYSPPLEAMEEVQLVRGTAALQYGAQFGGLLNYRTRAPDTSRVFSAHGSVTGGSFGLRNLFGAVGGRVGALDWQGYTGVRGSDGFRDGAESAYDAQFLAVTWRARPTLAIRAQVGRSWYRHRIPGPLTDAMFAADPRSATRTRNWFSPDIVVPAVRAEWAPSPRTRVSAQLSGLFGDRSSVQFIGFATTPDVRDAGSGEYATRVVDIDDFDSRTAELRLTHEHRIGGREALLATGVTVANNHLRRRQQGVGSRGADYDLAITGDFGRDLRYRSTGLSWYAEEMLRLTDRWRIVPGVRIERGRTDMTGVLAYYDPADTPRRVRHDFPLLGIRSSFELDASTELYGGWSEAYRPMLLKDLLPENSIERTDPGMRDARGWTAEAGVRGRRGRLSLDVGAFLMRYDDRFGGLLRDDGSGPYLFKTNIGSARTFGVEATLDALLGAWPRLSLRGFVAGSLFDAVYREGTAVSGATNVPLKGNRVEGVPGAIVRTGLVAQGRSSTFNLLVSHTSASFADALNTRTPTPNGARGIVPAYTVFDLTASRRIGERLRVRAGVSNIADLRYFTKRPAFYPGPGVWPSDGRSAQLGIEVSP